MNAISLHGVSKCFGTTPVLTDVDLAVPEGTVTAIVGASGSGKTTLLRLVTGFERVDAGVLSIGGHVVDDTHRFVRPELRGIGYVPQEGALFPHLTVAKNIAFGIAKEARGRVGELLELVGLEGLERRYPHQLSGGQQQRVALARALAIRPKVVLLDEPFSSLDTALRGDLGRDVIRVLRETNTTAVLVTHDQGEAMALADQISIIRGGRVMATADPRSLYLDPPTVQVAEAIGDANFLEAELRDGVAQTVLGEITCPECTPNDSGRARVLLRPEQLHVEVAPTPGATAATVVETSFYGHDAMVTVAIDGAENVRLDARAPGDVAFRLGQDVWVRVVGKGRAWPYED